MMHLSLSVYSFSSSWFGTWRTDLPQIIYSMHSHSLVLDEPRSTTQNYSDFCRHSLELLNARTNYCFYLAPSSLYITKLNLIFTAGCCQAHSNLGSPGEVSAASPQLYYTTFTCTNNLGFNWIIHARKSFVRRRFLSHLPSGPQGQQKAITSVPKLQATRDQFLLLGNYTHTDSSQRREGRDRGQVSGVFSVFILSILCCFVELSYIPSIKIPVLTTLHNCTVL